MLKDEYDVYIFKQGDNKIAPEFKAVDVNVTEYPKYVVDKEVFKSWVKENKLDAVIFNEYNQWGNDGQNLVAEAKALGAKAYGWLVLEKLGDAEDYKDYDSLIASTVTHTRVLRRIKARNFTYIPYSIDLTEFPDVNTKDERDEKKPFTFFHPGGYLGVRERKNTKAVIEGFMKLNNENTKLVITTQQKINMAAPQDNIVIIEEDLPRDELLKLYREADAVVLPSKWETIGLPILESLASGIPVITTNTPPMNEFVKEGLNGYLCKTMVVRYPEIFVPVAEVSADEIKNKMENMLNPMLHSILKNNTRKGIEKLYDLEKNKKYFLDFLRGELK